VSEQEVFEAADALLARGERPTIDRVRQELGRGSPNTVTQFLDSWWAALSKRVGGVQAQGLPPALYQAAIRFYGEIRVQAMAEAQSALAEQQRLAGEAQQALEAGQAAMRTEKAGMESTIEALRAELARISDARQGLTRLVAQQQVDLDNALEKTNLATRALQRAQHDHERTSAAAKAELERVREQWQGNEKHWLVEIEHLREEAKRQRGEHDRAQKASQSRIGDLEQQLSSGAKERAQLRVTVDQAQRELAQEREKRSFAEGAMAAKGQLLAGPVLPTRPRRRRMPAKR
jgi:hypothetical protein